MYTPLLFGYKPLAKLMDAEQLKLSLWQKLQLLDYELHACQQTLKLFQLDSQSNPCSIDRLISGQKLIHKQLQDQYDKITEQLAKLR